jgi:hypothetical protein
MHTGFQIPNVYDYLAKLCKEETQVIKNVENAHIRKIAKGESLHRKYKRFKLGGC